MEVDLLEELKQAIGSDKTYLDDGYYRIRPTEFGGYELAYLKPEGCATTSVHPQITIEQLEGKWMGVKLIDMATSPTKFLTRDNGEGEEIDLQLNFLLEKMKQAIQK